MRRSFQSGFGFVPLTIAAGPAAVLPSAHAVEDDRGTAAEDRCATAAGLK